jgi:hypothetical protein
MDNIEHWATKTEEYEEALEALFDCDERLAEYAEAVAGLREAARAITTQGAVEALERIQRLRAKWDAPDSGGDEAWAAVGSEAHKIASAFLEGQ